MADRAYSSPKSASKNEQDWDQVRDAIVQRWPQINQAELRTCDSNSQALIDFVAIRVNAGRDEIEAFVRDNEPATASKLENLTETAGQQYERAANVVGQAYRQTERQIQQHPTEATTFAFVTGLVVGVVTATLYFTSRPQPSVWQNVKDSYRRG